MLIGPLSIACGSILSGIHQFWSTWSNAMLWFRRKEYGRMSVFCSSRAACIFGSFPPSLPLPLSWSKFIGNQAADAGMPTSSRTVDRFDLWIPFTIQ